MLSPVLFDLLDLTRERGGLVILVFARASGCFALLPFFPKGLLPQQVRFALPIAMLPLLVIGAGPGAWTSPPLSWALLAPLAVEFFVGIAVSLPVCILFWAARAAGEMVDIQTGANNQELYAAMTGGNDGPAAQLFVQLALLGFLAAGGLQELLAALWASYGAVPPGGAGAVNTALLPELAGRLITLVSTLALKVCMPLVAAFLMIELTFAMAARKMKELPLQAITAAVKSLLLPLALIFVLQLFPEYLRPVPLLGVDLTSLFKAPAPR